MFRTILVDDEPLVRIALREIIDWAAYGCEIVGEFANGKDALRFIEREGIDLLITDIEMPVMNGIALLRELRQKKEQAAIVLSAYSHYDYVREAFLQGAYDYIIKEDIGAEYVGGIVGKAVEKLRRLQGEQERKGIEESIKQSEEERRRFRDCLTSGNCDMEATQGSYESQVMVSILVDRSRTEEQLLLDDKQAKFLLRTAQQVFDSHKLTSLMVDMDRYELAAAITIPALLSAQGVRQLLQSTLTQAASHIEQYLNISVSIGVSEPALLASERFERYKQARQLAGLRLYYGHGRIHFPEELHRMGKSSAEVGAAAHLRMDKWLPLIEHGESGWEAELEQALREVEQLALPPERLFTAYRGYVHELGALLNAKGLQWGDEVSPLAQLERMETMKSIHKWLLRLARETAERIHPRNRDAEQALRPVEAVKLYIERHYSEPISLTQASRFAGVSETYLSKLFPKETGETFVEYLTRRRVEKAIPWMNSGLKLYEIAERVGYPDQGHFTKIFKKVTGMTPQEYREHAVQNPPRKG